MMEEINWDEWEEITHEEYMDIGEEDVMWIMFHHGSEHLRGYYFKRRSHPKRKVSK